VGAQGRREERLRERVVVGHRETGSVREAQGRRGEQTDGAGSGELVSA